MQLLKLALRKAHANVELKPHPVFMLQVRAMREVEQQSGLDIVWTMTSAEREQALLPIRIPIDRGLLGWRLLLVQPAKLPAFASTTTLARLKTLRGGQGADWPDTTILRAAGLEIDESARYGDLFQKLAAGRIDDFPRSVQEIWGELDVHRDEGFVVEPTLALHYPTAMYFFVDKQRGDLAAEIRKGLEIALKDGSFQALFMQNFGAFIERAQLGKRRVFEMANLAAAVDAALRLAALVSAESLSFERAEATHPPRTWARRRIGRDEGRPARRGGRRPEPISGWAIDGGARCLEPTVRGCGLDQIFSIRNPKRWQVDRSRRPDGRSRPTACCEWRPTASPHRCSLSCRQVAGSSFVRIGSDLVSRNVQRSLESVVGRLARRCISAAGRCDGTRVMATSNDVWTRRAASRFDAAHPAWFRIKLAGQALRLMVKSR